MITISKKKNLSFDQHRVSLSNKNFSICALNLKKLRQAEMEAVRHALNTVGNKLRSLNILSFDFIDIKRKPH